MFVGVGAGSWGARSSPSRLAVQCRATAGVLCAERVAFPVPVRGLGLRARSPLAPPCVPTL
eukprot:5269648-Alexandrium_andersonii.AAC.1